MKKIILAFLLFSITGISQNLNSYQYALVPSKFSFLREVNQFNANVMTKLFMQKFGFETYFETDEQSKEFLENNCNKVFVDLIENNTAFTTKLKVVLKDCKGNILATSPEGTSREKEYNVAYNQAIRMAFEGFSILKNHKFQPSEKRLDTKDKSISVNEEPVKMDDKSTVSKYDSKEWTYVVKKELNGFLITDTANSKFFLQLLKTNNPLIFIGKSDRGNGVVIVKNDYLIFEYYENSMLISMQIMVKIQ